VADVDLGCDVHALTRTNDTTINAEHAEHAESAIRRGAAKRRPVPQAGRVESSGTL